MKIKIQKLSNFGGCFTFESTNYKWQSLWVHKRLHFIQRSVEILLQQPPHPTPPPQNKKKFHLVDSFAWGEVTKVPPTTYLTMYFLPTFFFLFFSPSPKKLRFLVLTIYTPHPPQFCDIKKKFKKLAKVSQIYTRKKNPKIWARNKVTKMFQVPM